MEESKTDATAGMTPLPAPAAAPAGVWGISMSHVSSLGFLGPILLYCCTSQGESYILPEFRATSVRIYREYIEKTISLQQYRDLAQADCLMRGQRSSPSII